MTLSMGISRNKGCGCAVFEVEGHKFFVPQISMDYVRPQWKSLVRGRKMFDMFKEAEAELIDSSTVKLSHPEWDGDLVLQANEYRTVKTFGSGTLYSTFRGMKVKVFKSVMCGEWDTDTTHETW
jgi:hypothetical protein